MNFLSVKKITLFGWMLILLAVHQPCRGSDQARYLIPVHAFDATFSTNWTTAVKAALSTKGDLDFRHATNLLCRASQDGNVSAQALWGFTLLIVSRSPEDAEAGLHLLRTSATNGNVMAMLQLGSLYAAGKYVRLNYNETFHWYNLAADKDDPNAQFQLGDCYRYGLGAVPDLTAAAMWYHRAAEQTNYVAMKSLGYLLMNGMGVESNSAAAKFWLTRAAKEGGNRRAMYNLGALCSRSFHDTNSMAEAFQWYKQSAELDDDLACLELANFYYRGWGGVQINPASYRYWQFKAAMLGSTDAQFYIGQAYRLGEGVPKDPENSRIWYEKAAAKNHPRAFYDLALYYLANKTNQASALMANKLMLLSAQAGHREAQFQYAMSCFVGDVASMDCDSGEQWLAKAAEAKWAKAEFALFQLYYNGIAPAPGCPSYPKDKTEGIKWLRRAAENENLKAQSVLAVMLIRGIEIEMDKTEAEELLRNAAEHGYPEAQSDLGFAILNGDLASRDPAESAMWSKLAEAHLTDPDTLRRTRINLGNAMSQLSADQQFQVDSRVNRFQPPSVIEIDPMPLGWEKNPSYQPEDGEFYH